MSTDDTQHERDLSRATAIAIRIGTLTLLAAWCFVIVSPFLLPIAWGVIIAIALYGPYEKLSAALRGRTRLAATLVAAAVLAFVTVPSALIAGSLADDVNAMAQSFHAGDLRIPPPPDRVHQWPIVGEPIFRLWLHASQDLRDVIRELAPRMEGGAKWLLATLADFGLAILEFVFATIISGFVLAGARPGALTVRALALRLGGERGPALVELATDTVRGVTRGILLVAVIQTILSGGGLFVAGVPGAALWSVLALIVSVVQIGIGVIMIPAAIWLFAHADMGTALVFSVYTAFVFALDNILKPLLMGRGLEVPMAVVFIGAVGGFITQGIIGLFVGAVVLVLGYELCLMWLDPALAVTAPRAEPAPEAVDTPA